MAKTSECPHCKTELRPHSEVGEGLAKFGAQHCDGCGCCFAEDGSLREGTDVCEAGREQEKSARSAARAVKAAAKVEPEKAKVEEPKPAPTIAEGFHPATSSGLSFHSVSEESVPEPKSEEDATQK